MKKKNHIYGYNIQASNKILFNITIYIVGAVASRKWTKLHIPKKKKNGMDIEKSQFDARKTRAIKL